MTLNFGQEGLSDLRIWEPDKGVVFGLEFICVAWQRAPEQACPLRTTGKRGCLQTPTCVFFPDKVGKGGPRGCMIWRLQFSPDFTT